ncbi:hypothetical protein [Woodsholea maritima]|uniref:hypothetical protein n=1 Tax=Woodsholea maritima TaxID=240237 RepID=UPI000368FB54|nr:hypothetical protein [Woodsholea maritima]
MSIRRIALSVITGFSLALGFSGLTQAQTQRTEDIALSEITGSTAPLVIDSTTPAARVDFVIAPGSDPSRIELVMKGSPLGTASGGVLSVAINEGRAIELSPHAQTFEARFTLYSEALRTGTNTLRLSFAGEEGVEGWRISQDASRLRVSTTPILDFASLSDFEAAMKSDFAGPRRIALDTNVSGRERLIIDAMLAQGLALRMGEAPVFVEEPQLAEIVIRSALSSEATGPRLRLNDGHTLVVEAPTLEGLVNASRLFAARQFSGQGDVFTPALALNAPSLGETRPLTASLQRDLTDFAHSAAPFSQNQGAQSAVVIATDTQAAHIAALSVLARAALAGGEAWVYAWYGDDAKAAPSTHNILFLGDLDRLDRHFLAQAPSELRAATDAAENRNPERRQFHFGSSAYADDLSEERDPLTGVAALYRLDAQRWMGVLAAPEGSDFARAARRLARHDGLWTSLSGRAALWDIREVTPFGERMTARTSALAAIGFVRAHDRWLALGLFAFSVFLLLMGTSVNRKSKLSV